MRFFKLAKNEIHVCPDGEIRKRKKVERILAKSRLASRYKGDQALKDEFRFIREQKEQSRAEVFNLYQRNYPTIVFVTMIDEQNYPVMNNV